MEVMGPEAVKSAPLKQSLSYLPWSHIFGLTCSLHASIPSGYSGADQIISFYVITIAVGGSVALVPDREAIQMCASLIQPAEMTSVPLLLNKGIMPYKT